ncbi:MAG TPA: cyclic peptide export ABC transporter [Lacunisphaera sp.]|jgi:putative ATP-binding cassette transporter|nr:cyclic peptide export ABC transporter [Lacunisphaera sp.]
MKLFKFLFNRCRRMLMVTVLTALVSGACNAGLIALINRSLHSSGRLALAWAFVALVAGKLGTGLLSQVWLIRYSQAAVADVRRQMVRRILGVPLRSLEETGNARLMAALVDDVNSLMAALLGFPLLAVNLAILLGGSVYLAYLSWYVLIGMAVLIVFGASCYRLFISSGFRSLFRARESEDRLYGHFRALTEGIKELKLHRERREAFMGESVHSATEEFQQHTVAAEIRFSLAHTWSHLLFYVLVGLILFTLPAMRPTSVEALTGFVLTVLYLMGPLAGVMSSLSVFSRADVALRKIDSLGVSLGGASELSPRSPAPNRFHRLELVGVSHTYRSDQSDDRFVLGPLDLTFHPGELVYLIGGNGSGKSTLAKIITGLYPPEQGEVRLDGRPVTDANRDDYRQLFSTVFSDFFLFDSLLGLQRPDLDVDAEEYLVRLHLNHKVRISNGTWSTTALSTGQRKRLALLTTYLEDRPFYVFDEWAADQDPIFKDVFYRRLLPELKRRNKAVLVITHDDRFFHLADRVLKLDYGQLVVSPAATPEFAAPGIAALRPA